MGKKKRSQPDLEEILSRPWCYYCERDFDDLKILINHQKAKHFKCERCGRRLNTAGVHMTQVHKESLTTIENALPNRAGLEVEIFGMEGIPEDVVVAHRNRVATQFVQAGNQPIHHNANPAAGTSGIKKPKLEAGSDLKKRLAEHRAKKAAEEASAVSNANTATPTTTVGQPQSFPPAQVFVSQPISASSNAHTFQTPPQYSQPFAGPPGPQGPVGPGMMAGPGFNGYAQPYGQATAPFQPPAFAPAPVPFHQPPFEAPFQAPPNTFMPPAQYQNGPLPMPSRPFGTGPPDLPHHMSTTMPTSMSPVPRPNSLPPAPGLPQRPSFGVPAVNAFQLQQMHQGHIPAQGVPYIDQPKTTNGALMPTSNGTPETVMQPTIQPVPMQATNQTLPTQPSGQAILEETKPAEVKPVEAKPVEATTEKKGKKDKDKDTKLVYSDNEISPEEKLSKLARYAFQPINAEGAAIGTVDA